MKKIFSLILLALIGNANADPVTTLYGVGISGGTYDFSVKFVPEFPDEQSYDCSVFELLDKDGNQTNEVNFSNNGSFYIEMEHNSAGDPDSGCSGIVDVYEGGTSYLMANQIVTIYASGVMSFGDWKNYSGGVLNVVSPTNIVFEV